MREKTGLASDLLESASRQTSPSRFTFALDARRDIDAVVEDIVAVDYDVANVDADAEGNLLGATVVALRYLGLHADRS